MKWIYYLFFDFPLRRGGRGLGKSHEYLNNVSIMTVDKFIDYKDFYYKIMMTGNITQIVQKIQLCILIYSYTTTKVHPKISYTSQDLLKSMNSEKCLSFLLEIYLGPSTVQLNRTFVNCNKQLHRMCAT